MSQSSFRIVFAGGGSGGHVYPLIAVAESVNKLWPAGGLPPEMVYMGPRDSYAAIFENHDIQVRPILAGKLRRYFSLENFFDAPKFFIGFLQALFRLYFIMPDVIFSKGGAGAFPVVVAGWWYRIPVVIHESDVKPGLNNLFSARFAKKVCVGFSAAAESFDARKVVVTGSPIRKELIDEGVISGAAKDALGFSASDPMIFVQGGSQGSLRINTFILENLKSMVGVAQVFHQAGVVNFPEVEKLSQAALVGSSYANRYRVVSFLDDVTMKLSLSAADLVICRSGAGTLCELAAFGKPSILIPHGDGSNGHQQANAYAFAKNGAAIVIENDNLLPGIVLSEIKKILGDKALREKMADAARAQFVPNAADMIAAQVLECAVSG
jgi:UDP-N-acetylglucosamine--N-acetylmuramyl-(pentapeptide) pyrophosphoryl-undecaprenol N-acetylglucosamine transferase